MCRVAQKVAAELSQEVPAVLGAIPGLGSQTPGGLARPSLSSRLGTSRGPRPPKRHPILSAFGPWCTAYAEGQQLPNQHLLDSLTTQVWDTDSCLTATWVEIRAFWSFHATLFLEVRKLKLS